MFAHRHNVFSIWQRRLLATAVVLFASVLFAPQQAAASCGDYVMIEGQSAAGSSHGASAGHSGTPHRVPVCQGPGCRQRRELPASPPNRVTLDEHSWGLPPKVIDVAPELSLFAATSAEPVAALAVAAGIYRPPRSNAAV